MPDADSFREDSGRKDEMMGEFVFYEEDIMLQEADGFFKTYERLELEDERMMYGDEE